MYTDIGLNWIINIPYTLCHLVDIKRFLVKVETVFNKQIYIVLCANTCKHVRIYTMKQAVLRLDNPTPHQSP